MVARPFWTDIIQTAWKRRPIVWLSGVRRAGKTVLAHMIPDAIYLNCDLPSVQIRLADPEPFYAALAPGSTVVFDEIHRLADPSIILRSAPTRFHT